MAGEAQQDRRAVREGVIAQRAQSLSPTAFKMRGG
jgi:hypothetical protein